MKLYTGILIFLICFTFLIPLHAVEQVVEPMKKMEPFVGKWKTLSLYPDKGLKVPGVLEYRWVLGENWLMVDFVGDHPQRDFWAAIAMIKFDAKKNRYISYEYFNADDPTIMTGYWLNEKTIRFEVTGDTGSSGIDYTLTEEGAVYQENWVHSKKGKRKITLKTDYTRIK